MNNHSIENLIAARQAEYEQLCSDSNYIDVKFNPINGALHAIHIDHNFDPTIGCFGIPRGNYERNAADVLYNYGHSVILGSEKMVRGVKMPDGLLDGQFFEIKSVEGSGQESIRNKLKSAHKQGVATIVMYYHDARLFDKRLLLTSYLRHIGASQRKIPLTIYYVVANQLGML